MPTNTITWNDIYALADVVVVTENFARQYWNEPIAAVGRRIRNNPKDPWRTIVGVVGNERDDGTAQPAPVTIYWPLLVKNFWSESVHVHRAVAYAIRTDRVTSPTLLKEIQQAIWSVNRSLPVANVRTLSQIQAQSMAQTSFALVMLAIAAGVALLLGVAESTASLPTWRRNVRGRSASGWLSARHDETSAGCS